MQQRRVGVERLNHRPHRVAGAGAGAGQRYAQARETPVRVGHGDRPASPRAGEANFIALPHRIGDRQIMNRNDAVHRRHRILFQSPAIASPTVILSLIICLLRVFVIRVMRRGVSLVAPAVHLMAQRQIHAFLLHVGLDAVQALRDPARFP